MGQMRVVCNATSEFMAVTVRKELLRGGVHSVQLLNEIPMKPGFTFGLRPYSEILVRDEDTNRALEVIDECREQCGFAEPAPGLPPTIRAHAASWFSVMFVSVYVLVLLPGVINIFVDPWSGLGRWFEKYQFYFIDYPYFNFDISFPLAAISVMFVFLGIAFFILNSRLLLKAHGEAFLGLLALPVCILWLAGYVVWLMLRSIPRLIQAMIDLGKPDQPATPAGDSP